MDWLDNLQKAINYIEEHLLEDEMITDMNISHEIYSSTDSFRTIFRVVTGYSVGEYIRNRRLSLSGEELIQSGHTILDIALKYGYDTPESFSRAFTRFHRKVLQKHFPDFMELRPLMLEKIGPDLELSPGCN